MLVPAPSRLLQPLGRRDADEVQLGVQELLGYPGTRALGDVEREVVDLRSTAEVKAAAVGTSSPTAHVGEGGRTPSNPPPPRTSYPTLVCRGPGGDS